MISQSTLISLKAYPQSCKDVALAAPDNLQLGIFGVRAENNSGSASDIGLVRKFARQSMKLWAFDGSSYDEIVLPISAGQQLIPASNGDGFVLQTKKQSGLIGLTISQDDSGSSAYTYEYWDGNSWETLTTVAVFDFTSTGDSVAVFQPPLDWAPGGDGDLDPDMYSIRVVAGTAGATAVEVDAIWSGQLLELFRAVANNSALEIEFYSDRPLVLDAGEGVMPYFSVANAANSIRTAYATL